MHKGRLDSTSNLIKNKQALPEADMCDGNEKHGSVPDVDTNESD